MARRRGWQFGKGDEVEINGQVLTVLEVSDAASRTINLSDDYLLRIKEDRNELFKRNRLAADKEEITAVPLSSIKIMKQKG